MLNLLEKIIGRDLLWRISRRAYVHARREGSLDFDVNGEAWLQRQFAQRSQASGTALTIVDVGANYGQWSSAMIKALREADAPPPSMTLFEPIPAIRARLEPAMAALALGEFRIEPFALSDQAGEMKMTRNDVAAGTHHLGPVEYDEVGDELTVKVRTLDDYWADRGGGPIDLVKIDAEGYDPSVIAGMRGLMAAGSVDVIQFEYGELFRRTRRFLRDMMEIAHTHRYLYGTLHRNGIELLDQWHFDMESFFGSNKLLIHPRALEWLPAKRMTYSPRNTLIRA